MTDKPYDIVGIGAAIVDILSYKDDEFLQEHNLIKGSMTLVDEKEIQHLYSLAGTSTECSGGSAANTLAGYGLLCHSNEAEARAAFIGKVNKGDLGHIFTRSLNKAGVHFITQPATEDDQESTARCLIMVTEEENPYGGRPRVERTMATYLGISGKITEDDIDEEVISQAKLLFFEGYSWDSDSARRAVQKAIRLAKEHDTKVAFSLSDPFCVERHHQDFLKLVEEDVNILFANEHEIEALYEEKDLRKILYRLSEQSNESSLELAAVTRSEKGSYILAEGNIYTIDPVIVEDVYDVTGAGDLYASGLLYGYLHGFDYEKCGKLGAMCASEVIKFLGGRPMSKLYKVLEAF